MDSIRNCYVKLSEKLKNVEKGMIIQNPTVGDNVACLPNFIVYCEDENVFHEYLDILEWVEGKEASMDNDQQEEHVDSGYFGMSISRKQQRPVSIQLSCQVLSVVYYPKPWNNLYSDALLKFMTKHTLCSICIGDDLRRLDHYHMIKGQFRTVDVSSWFLFRSKTIRFDQWSRDLLGFTDFEETKRHKPVHQLRNEKEKWLYGMRSWIQYGLLLILTKKRTEILQINSGTLNRRPILFPYNDGYFAEIEPTFSKPTFVDQLLSYESSEPLWKNMYVTKTNFS